MDVGGIYLKQGTGELVEMRQQPYESEDVLQKLLANHPALLAGEQMNSGAPRRWLLISREFGVPSTNDGGNIWSADHLFLDQDAVPTIVEVKRSTDSRIRREVVGQMLEYAANGVVYWPVEKVRAIFEANTITSGQDPTEVLAHFLELESDSLESQTALDEFWQRVKTNMQAGKVRLVFVADAVPPELRRIVEFLNGQMDPAEVFAVEVRQYVGEGLTTLVPRLVGQTATSEQKKATPSLIGPQWGENRFFQKMDEQKINAKNIEVARRIAEDIEVVRKIIDWVHSRDLDLEGGHGLKIGSLSPVLHHGGQNYKSFLLWTDGNVQIEFHLMTGPFAMVTRRRELLERLNAIPGISITEDSLNGQPNLKRGALCDPTRLDQFLQVFDWMLTEIKIH